MNLSKMHLIREYNLCRNSSVKGFFYFTLVYQTFSHTPVLLNLKTDDSCCIICTTCYNTILLFIFLQVKFKQKYFRAVLIPATGDT
jgi:hypothetical protein